MSVEDLAARGTQAASTRSFRARRELRPAASGAADAPLDFEILIPIWGERYIRRFAELSLRTLLAPGNLPWLAEHHRMRVTILTAAASLPYFDTQPAFRQLAMLADISFVQIDDLIATYVPNYSSILTRAFNRAMAISPDMLGRNFVFLVGDLIFADGAFEAVARAMAAGSDTCIMCSPRAEADSLEPVLARQGTTEELVLSNREMVRLLLDHMHPTTVAKVVHGDGVHLSIAHQFFWRPEPELVVSRCFLLHMLCIRPRRRPADIAAPCDFSYVGELAPDGRHHYLTDSDSFVALEVQDSGHEAQYITTHPLPPAEIAERLSYWSTAQHREFVTATFMFRAGESICSTAEATALTQPYIDKLTAQLPPPREHHHHPFWLGSVGAEVLSKPRDEAVLDGSDRLPPVLHRLILQHLASLPPDRPALAVSVTDRPGAADLVLARHAAIAVRIPVQRFYDVLEDVTGPEGPLLVVAGGDLQDFLRLFRDRARLQRLLRAVGTDRTVLLSFAVDPDALRQGQPSRGHLRDLVALSLPLFARFGLVARIHDLADSPLDGRHGCAIEIVADAAGSFRAPPAVNGTPDDPFVGQRGDWAMTTALRQPVTASPGQGRRFASPPALAEPLAGEKLFGQMPVVEASLAPASLSQPAPSRPAPPQPVEPRGGGRAGGFVRRLAAALRFETSRPSDDSDTPGTGSRPD